MTPLTYKQEANQRIKEAFPEMEPSGGHDHVDEIIGLLRIARMHVTDCEERASNLYVKNKQFRELMVGALGALRSYEYGNSSPVLAKEFADKIESLLK